VLPAQYSSNTKTNESPAICRTPKTKTSEAGVAGFLRGHLGHCFASTKQVAEMTEAFVESIMQFGLDHKIDLIRFQKGQRKDDVMQGQLGALKEASRRSGLYRRSPGKSACASNGAQGLRRGWHYPLDQLQQRTCELLLFLLPG
jgi:hypothetical protein